MCSRDSDGITCYAEDSCNEEQNHHERNIQIQVDAFDNSGEYIYHNGDIVFKSQYDITILEDGDNLEIVSFVGGG